MHGVSRDESVQGRYASCIGARRSFWLHVNRLRGTEPSKCGLPDECPYYRRNPARLQIEVAGTQPGTTGDQSIFGRTTNRRCRWLRHLAPLCYLRWIRTAPFVACPRATASRPSTLHARPIMKSEVKCVICVASPSSLNPAVPPELSRIIPRADIGDRNGRCA